MVKIVPPPITRQIADKIAEFQKNSGKLNLVVGKIDPADLASVIDHTLLKADATHEDIERVCKEAVQYGFATVCVNSCWIPTVTRLLAGSKSVPIAVVGFPLGAASTASKVFETRDAIQNGAREIDMVIHQGALKSGDYPTAFEDVRKVVEAAGPIPVKVILETAGLNEEQKIAGCVIAEFAGAAFVKTSTGFGPGGATAEDVALMRAVVSPKMRVKASGGVRTREDAIRMIQAGADRIGASSSVAIATGAAGQAGLY